MDPKIGIVAVAAVVALIVIGMFTGLVPLSLVNADTKTSNNDHGGIKGSGELIQRQGFIASYLDDGYSEDITVIGKGKADLFATGAMKKYRYMVYGKTESSDWSILSEPGKTEEVISIPNPGEKSVSGFHTGSYNADDYRFNFKGSEYKAVRVEFQGYIDPNLLNPLDGNYKWRTLQSDEAYLYRGWGGLYLPKGDDGRPRSTFEVGETVNIGVETTYGGQAVGEGKTWRVALIRPSDQGGSEIKHSDYGDNVKNGVFSFTITEDMFSKTSSNRYSIQIYNTLVPKGTLNVYSIDLLANAPSDVTFKGPEQSKMNRLVTIDISASTNSDTQLPVDHFDVSVIEGCYDVLLPSDPLSNLWIIQTKRVDVNNNHASISFTPDKESFVTVHAVAVDSEGRSSLRTQTWTMWIYEHDTVPDGGFDDCETGQHDYAGGKTNPRFPRSPYGFWETEQSMMYVIIICILLFVMFAVAAFSSPLNPVLKILIVVLGAVLAYTIYYLWNNGFL